ncbi:MAG: excinuclease ABC subunit UvrA [Bacillota bacterium]
MVEESFFQNEIIIKGARENNLQNIDVSIPKNKLIVLTGLSGSGKSSLAYDTLQKECQRQYMESMGMVTDLVSKPRVDRIIGLSPSISVDQHLTNRNPRSTVGTATEIYTYLRILYAKLGERDCPKCGSRVAPPYSADEQLNNTSDEEEEYEESFACPLCGESIPELSMAHFSFNKPQGACEICTGLGVIYEADWSSLLDDEKSILDGAVREWDEHLIKWNTNTFEEAGKYYGFSFDMNKPVKLLSQIEKDFLFYGVNHERFKKHFPGKEAPETSRKGRFEGVSSNILRRYAERADNAEYREKMEKHIVKKVCPGCNGERLNQYSRNVTIFDDSIVRLADMSLEELQIWIGAIKERLASHAAHIAKPIIDDLEERISKFVDIGIGYLSMNRGMTTLSGGEAQRLRLASLLGSGLTGVLYVLDEPTTGLHSRDTKRLLAVLKKLRNMGNTVLVIEHDTDMMLEADWIIDMGPGAGRAGGRIVAAGTPEELMHNTESITGRHLNKHTFENCSNRSCFSGSFIEIKGAKEHNLKNIDVSIPIGSLIAVTGVSGSGKSTLVFDILDKAVSQRLNSSRNTPGKHESIWGLEKIDRIATVDQTPIGRIPRSNAATYTDIFTPIRSLFSGLSEAKSAGLTARDFSFNVPGGRCDRCEGAGVLTIGMHFLPDVEVTCPVCKGKRFKRQILAVKYKNMNISDVLEMSIDEALELFSDRKEIAARLKVLADVGMGYLKLGQPATTLSGGEAQRVKLAKELGRNGKGHALYLLDEPTTGLHPEDVRKLITLLRKLVEAGNSVCVVEHNLELIHSSDWIIDLGPEGGEKGGMIIAQGTPEDVMKIKDSYTGNCLRQKYL